MIKILAAPNLKISWMKMRSYLRGANYDSLFLNFPQNLENLIVELSNGKLTLEDFIDIVKERKMLPEPVGSWIYVVEPILKSLRELKQLKPNMEIFCYRDVEYSRISMQIASEIAILTLRTSITGKVNVKEWKSLLIKGIGYRWKALKVEADFIHERTSHYSICTSDLYGELLKQSLERKGEEVDLVNVEEFYHPTPLEILEERLMKEDVLDEEVGKLIGEHLEYVRDYILKGKNRDQAYYRWAYNKVPLIRQRISLEEIKALAAFP